MRNELKDMSQELEKLTVSFTTHPSSHHIIPVLLTPVLDARKPCSDIETQSLTGTLEIFITWETLGMNIKLKTAKWLQGVPLSFLLWLQAILGLGAQV